MGPWFFIEVYTVQQWFEVSRNNAKMQMPRDITTCKLTSDTKAQ